jgi:hypothetical protein
MAGMISRKVRFVLELQSRLEKCALSLLHLNKLYPVGYWQWPRRARWVAENCLRPCTDLTLLYVPGPAELGTVNPDAVHDYTIEGRFPLVYWIFKPLEQTS